MSPESRPRTTSVWWHLGQNDEFMGLAFHYTDLIHAWPYVLLVGASVGIVQSVFGLGGGVVMIPILPMIFKMEPRQAIATSLLTMGPVAIFNSLQVIWRREMIISRALRLGLFSMTGGVIAARSSAYVDGRYLLLGFGFATAWMAYQVFFKTVDNRIEMSVNWDYPVGLAIGLISGFTGVSGGVVASPYLNRLKAIPLQNVVPTSIGVLCLTSLAGAMTFAYEQWGAWRNPQDDQLFSYHVVALLILSAVISSRFGLAFQSRVPQRIKLAVLGVLLIGLSARSFFQALSAS